LSISFLHSGLYTTIQDQGRSLGGRLGVPQSGAMDKTALNLANMIVGNGQSEAAIECTLIGPRIRFDQEVVICICGAVVQPFVDDQPIKMNTISPSQEGYNLTSIWQVDLPALLVESDDSLPMTVNLK